MSEFNIRILTHFAADYDCNAYSQGTFNNNACATQSADGGSTAPSGGLADTGYDVIIPVALGLALVIAGGILLVKRMKRKIASNKK
ncbi:MAG TPA: LPXTG cell wall anchor domain-containing protein [Candidatus Saccharimonadales bacterium]